MWIIEVFFKIKKIPITFTFFLTFLAKNITELLVYFPRNETNVLQSSVIKIVHLFHICVCKTISACFYWWECICEYCLSVCMYTICVMCFRMCVCVLKYVFCECHRTTNQIGSILNTTLHRNYNIIKHDFTFFLSECKFIDFVWERGDIGDANWLENYSSLSL